MPWPTVPVVTTGIDQDTDPLPRSDILDLTTKFNQLIAMRGVASGVCDLDAGGLVPDARIPSSIARLASPTFTGAVVVPAATASNQAVNKGQADATYQPAGSYAQLSGANFTGPVTFNGTLGQLKANGDIQAVRAGGTTGFIFFNSANSAYLYFDGTNYQIVGGNLYAPLMVSNGSAVLTTATPLNYVSKDQNYNNVGSFCFAGVQSSSGLSGVTGATISGAYLYPAAVTNDPNVVGSVYLSATALPGTWRCIGATISPANGYQSATLFQRIA